MWWMESTILATKSYHLLWVDPVEEGNVYDFLHSFSVSFSKTNNHNLPFLDTPLVTEEEIWDCTTCRNYLEHCPVFIEPMGKLMEFRRNLVLNHGKNRGETHFAFRNIERKGNPWGFDPEKRMWWTKDLGVKEVFPGAEGEILFCVGCFGSYDDRNIEVATSLIHILNRAGVNFGVLGSQEWCCGIDLRRMGSEYLFQVNAKRNIDQLQQVKF